MKIRIKLADASALRGTIAAVVAQSKVTISLRFAACQGLFYRRIMLDSVITCRNAELVVGIHVIVSRVCDNTGFGLMTGFGIHGVAPC